MHDIFKDILKPFAPKEAAPDPREVEAALIEIHLAQIELLRLQSRIAELNATLDRSINAYMGEHHDRIM